MTFKSKLLKKADGSNIDGIVTFLKDYFTKEVAVGEAVDQEDILAECNTKIPDLAMDGYDVVEALEELEASKVIRRIKVRGGETDMFERLQ